ncbi:MAG: hypothetical protein K2X86_08220 [Cytophagaceae bacterium]|nr:hypothetical protein [Cytophagaceae bacterium]
MIQRILNIALVFALLISFIGVSATKVYCASMKETMEKRCCDNKNANKDCCKDIKQTYKLTTDLSSVNASVAVQDVTLFAVIFLTSLPNNIAVQEKLNSYSTYSSPHITSDIPVLIQVFRI